MRRIDGQGRMRTQGCIVDKNNIENAEIRRPRTRIGTERDRTRIENREARIETRSGIIEDTEHGVERRGRDLDKRQLAT
jgi:hypothetical protein